MDRFATTLYFEDGSTEEMNAAGDVMSIEGRGTIVRVQVNTGKRIKRAGRV
jgi:hypothetical protein